MKSSEILLLIDDNASETSMIQGLFGQTGEFPIECVTRLSTGIDRVNKGGIGAILLRLSLLGGKGTGSFDKMFAAAPHIPILILSDPNNEEIAKLSVQRGAHDYVDVSRMDYHSVSHAVDNMIERKKAEEALFVEKERAEVTLNSIGDAVLSTDIAGNITYLNVVAEKMTGWARKNASGRPLSEVFKIIDGATREPSPNPMEMAVRDNKTVGLTANCILIRRDGVESAIEDSAAPIHDRTGKVTGAVIVFHDVSASRAMRQQMSHLAQHDFLTDLPNRMLLMDRLTESISLAKRHGERLAVLFLDLDRFKNVNDSLGHVIGDQVLQSVAARMASCVRRSDTVCRMGGDEFVVLLSELDHGQDAAISAMKLLATLGSPHLIATHDLHVPASIGISIYPEDGQDAETLIHNADIAMYHAKEKGRNNFQFFKQLQNDCAAEKSLLEDSLHMALERDEFSLHYQPKINLETGAIVGVEALLRWRHPQRGLIPPREFIPIAEDTGMIVPIGQWVLREACRQARAWADAGLGHVPVAVNISAVEFRNKEFLENVRNTLSATELDPASLELELTETTLMQHVEFTSSVLDELKKMGVLLAIDDFGTGYSSLSYLSLFAIDSVKVDQSFVREISSNSADATIVSAVIGMGNNLNKRVIAEGVETREQSEYLQGKGCQEGQGFFFHRPMPADEFTKLLEASMSGVIPS